MSDFPGTAAWLRAQWSNPRDIFTILLILGGDIVQVAIAQLCAGPVLYLTPVSFSFGWVAYAVSATRSTFGSNRLMPDPEVDCILINAKSGYSRTNHSWVLSRILRDFDHWRPNKCDKRTTEKLEEIRKRNRESKKPRKDEEVRIGLRVVVMTCQSASGRGNGDAVYWFGILVSAIQFGISAIPWGIYGEWLTFMVTAAGTLLAYSSSALPQWVDEKVGVRHIQEGDEEKSFLLTEGNGAANVIMILGCEGGMDLEALAAPQRNLRRHKTTRPISLLLAALWLCLLVSVAGYEQHTWYLLGIGILGILHNVGVAGMERQPKALGIDLQYTETILEQKVMEVLWLVEISYPKAGAALLPEFFPGKLSPREEKLWEYAARREQRYARERKTYNTNIRNSTDPGEPPALWDMPPRLRPEGREDDNDIPENGPYDPARPNDAHDNAHDATVNASATDVV